MTYRPTTLGELVEAGYRHRSVRDEMRENLLAMLARGENPFPGILGYDRTVVPALVNAVLARHDLILLGLRGQAKTRILRALVNLLDEETPVIAGSELNESPFAPFTKYARSLAATAGDDVPVAWLPREARYREKLATPDVTIADLIGDVDPVKAATLKKTFADEEVIHYGIVPRTNRGIFAINELPDLAPRIQVGLLNILEERDLQIRGFPVRIPLDVVMVFSANPEDYTNRGNIITPLKDRIASQILTHYPRDVATAKAITDQEAWTDRTLDGVEVRLPDSFRTLVEEIAFVARRSDLVDQASGVSARMPIAMRELLVSNMERRAVLDGREGRRPAPRRPLRHAPGHHGQGRDGLRGRAAGGRDRRPQADRRRGQGALRRDVPADRRPPCPRRALGAARPTRTRPARSAGSGTRRRSSGPYEPVVEPWFRSERRPSSPTRPRSRGTSPTSMPSTASPSSSPRTGSPPTTSSGPS